MNNQIKEMLEFDPLLEAEKITNTSYKKDEFCSSLGFLFALKNNLEKTKILRQNNDTCMGNNLIQQLEVIKDLGFELLCCNEIPGTKDKWRIFWRDGLLLFCDSYDEDTTLNSGKVYFNYCGPRMNFGSNGLIKKIDGQLIWQGDFDIREGLRYHIDWLNENGKILLKWIEQPFLWLLHYKDTKVENYDYEAINAERIALLPNKVQEAIKGE